MEFSRFLGLLNTSTSAARVTLVRSRPSKRLQLVCVVKPTQVVTNLRRSLMG